MKNYISVDQLIKRAKKKGVDFGKGDPYNRLRYYTKLSWLPHMIRQKDNKGNVAGHYPFWALDHLLLIEKLKEEGYSNDEIELKIKKKNKIREVIELLTTPDIRKQIISYLTLLLLVVITINEIGIINLGKNKRTDITLNQNSLSQQIIDNGTAFVPKGKNKIYVKNDLVTKTSKINITFTENYYPASRYWITEIRNYDGFVLELDAPAANNVEFNWWITK